MSAKKRKPEEGGQLHLVESEAKGRDGEVMLCECGSQLDAWDLVRPGHRPRLLLLCRKPSCPSSAEYSAAKILNATVVL